MWWFSLSAMVPSPDGPTETIFLVKQWQMVQLIAHTVAILSIIMVLT